MNDATGSYRDAEALYRGGYLEAAEAGYRSVLAAVPDHADAWHSLGLIFHQKRLFDAAIRHFEAAISYCQSKAVYFNNYGIILKTVERFDDAAVAFERAIELDPACTDVYVNLASAHLHRNDLVRAENELAIALAQCPGHITARNTLRELRFRQGNRLSGQDKFLQADNAFHEAASLPGGKEIWRWRSLSFCPSIFPDNQSIERYWTGLDQHLDRALQADIPIDWRSLPDDGFTPSFNLPHLNKCCKGVKEKIANLFAKAFPFDRPSLTESQKNRTKIRVGFVVTAGHHRGFLRVYQHLLEHLDRNKFEVFVLCPTPIVAACRQSVRSDDIQWVGLPFQFDLAVKMLFDVRCDILYHWKVGGGTLDYFLSMAKAAPIQCTSLGTHGTGGVAAVDYYISSSILEQPESASQYTERLVLLDAYATSHPHDPVQQPATREQFGLPKEGALYFCPHRLPKYHPLFDHYFRRILEKDSTGHILLLTGKKKEQTALFAARLASVLGQDLFRRMILVPSLPLDVYKKHLSIVTCVLDSPVYAGDLTTHDAFDQGVPIVTIQGELLIQRYTAGLYRLMGIESMIASDTENYAEIAVRLGREPDYRLDISNRIRERNGLVFAPDETVRDYERFFESACSCAATADPCLFEVPKAISHDTP